MLTPAEPGVLPSTKQLDAEQLYLRDFINTEAGLQDYTATWQAMKTFTQQRNKTTPDQLWLLEHTPVFTLGKAADKSHVLDAGDIPLIRVDRGGQVTYHGPGQIMVYALVDLARRKLSVREMVTRLEQVVIDVLAEYGVEAYGDRDAPGVYVESKKIAALGLRVSRGCSYHGFCFNYDFDTTVFNRINPCGYPDLQVTDLKTLLNLSPRQLPAKAQLCQQLVAALVKQFDYRSSKQLDK